MRDMELIVDQMDVGVNFIPRLMGGHDGSYGVL